MGTNNSQYEKLVKLRHAIASLPAARKEMGFAQEAQKRHQEKLRAAQNFIAKPIPANAEKYTGQLKWKFETEARQVDTIATNKARNRAKRQDNADITAKRFFLILATLVVFAVTAYLVYIAAQWSWETSLSTLIDISDATYKEAVGLHLFALSIALLIGGVIMLGFTNILDGAVETAISIFAETIMMIASTVSFFASFFYYFADASGFWDVFWHILVIIPAAFVSIAALWRAFVFVATVVLFFTSVLLMMTAVHNTEKKKTNYSLIVKNDAVKALDYTPLYNSDEYKEAKKLDAEYDRELDKINLQKYKDIVANETDCIDYWQKTANKYWSIVCNCNSTIKDAAEFLHPSYHNLKSLDTIIYYFEYNRADTITKAINEYIRDQQHIQMINKLDEMQRNQIRMMQKAVNTITNRLDTMQNAITSEIATVRSAAERQTAVIQKESENLQRQAQKSIDKLDDRLGDIISNQRFSLGW